MRYRASPPGSKSAAAVEEDFPDTNNKFDSTNPQRLKGGLQYDYFSDFKDKRIAWLWQDRLAVGKLNLVCGYAEKGKSQITLSIAATVTTGGQWPNNEGNAEQGAVIILSAEDDEEDTIKPRLKAAGADVSQCARIKSVVTMKTKGNQDSQSRLLNLYDDLGRLSVTIENMHREGRIVRLIIFDPINAYFGTKDNKTDSFKTSDMRAILTPLKEWAAEHRVAIIGITHFNKDNSGKNLLHRVVDSQAITAATRTVWACLENEETKQKVFVRGKNNIGPQDTKALAYEIEAVSVELDGDFEGETMAARIKWGGPVTASAEDLMRGTPGRKGDNAVVNATVFLEDLLSDGRKPASAVFLEARKAGHTPYAIRAAQCRLGVEPKKGDFGDGWYWSLPEPIADAADDFGNT